MDGMVRPKKNISLGSGDMAQKKRVGRSETKFFFILFFFTCRLFMCSLGDCNSFHYYKLVSNFKLELIQCFGSILLLNSR